MLSSQPLQNLPIGQPIDSVRLAVWREATYAAEVWQRRIDTPSAPVVEVLDAEQRLARQLGALGILADAKLYRRLRARLFDDTDDQGGAFVAAFLLLRHDRAASEPCVFDVWLQSKPGPICTALGLALALCGVRSAPHIAKLAVALTSQDGDVVVRTAALVARLGPLRAWPIPQMTSAAGLCAVLQLMRAGAIAPLPLALARAVEHTDPKVRQARLQTQHVLFPQAALAHSRSLAHQGRDLSASSLQILGLLYDPADPAAARDLALLSILSVQPDTADAALDALGLSGCGDVVQACLHAARRHPLLVGQAARSLQALFGLDHEFWAPYADEDGVLSPDVLEAAYEITLNEAPEGTLTDFQPRSLRGLLARLRCCDVAHLRARAAECQMRSGGQARLHPWAYLTPQLNEAAPMWNQGRSIDALTASADAQRRTPRKARSLHG